jgi:hypothetical protein
MGSRRSLPDGLQVICPSGCFAAPLSSPTSKNILVFRNENQRYIGNRPVPLEGRLEIVTDAGQDAVDADDASDESI